MQPITTVTTLEVWISFEFINLFCYRCCCCAQEEGLRLLSSEDRVTATEFREISKKAAASSHSLLPPYLLIDVRPALETTICRLPNSVNLPFQSLEQGLDQLKDLVRQRLLSSSSSSTGTLPGALHFWYLILEHIYSVLDVYLSFSLSAFLPLPELISTFMHFILLNMNEGIWLQLGQLQWWSRNKR